MTDDAHGGLERLTEQEREAVEWLAAGLSDEEAGVLVGVHRSTIFRWRRRPAFALELAVRVEARVAGIRRKISTMDAAALELVEEQLRAGHVESAFRYLRLRGAAAFGTPGAEAVSPEMVIDDVVDRLVIAIRAEVDEATWGRIAARATALAADEDNGGEA